MSYNVKWLWFFDSAIHTPQIKRTFINQLQFRDSDDILIPYYETKIIEKREDKQYFPIQSMRLGPKHNISQSKASLELFLKKVTEKEYPNKILIGDLKISDAGFVIR